MEKYNFECQYIKRCTQEGQVILSDKEEILKDTDYLSLIIARKNQL